MPGPATAPTPSRERRRARGSSRPPVRAAYRTAVKRREEVADGTAAFTFARPPGFAFTAGQSMEVELPPAVVEEAERRHRFTIASAPYEEDLMIATRMRPSAFKEALAALPAAVRVTLSLPGGRFTLHRDAARPAVFLAGGIGITAPRSIIRQALHEEAPHELFLFYTDRRPEEAAFLGELRGLARGHPRYTVVPTMTALDGAEEWDGEVGRIGMRMIREYVDDVHAALYYLSGPPRMVKAMRRMLRRAGFPEESVRTEEYLGY